MSQWYIISKASVFAHRHAEVAQLYHVGRQQRVLAVAPAAAREETASPS